MLLIECYIDNFGKLSGERISFRSGLNTILRENGWGKSTLLAFIKAMLYGLEDTRKQSLEENDRKRYLPWQGGGFGGSLSFSDGQKSYRIERTFSQKSSEDTFRLYDLGTGLPSADYSSAVGEELFGIDADGFERTVFLSEKSLTDKNDAKSISAVSAKLSNLVGVNGDVGELDDALKLLDERRKFYYKKGGGGEIGRLDAKIAEVNITLGELMRLRSSVAQTELEIKNEEARLSRLKKERSELLSLREKAGAISHYSAMKSRLEERERRILELRRFFGGHPVSEGEIELMHRKHLEAERLAAVSAPSPIKKALPSPAEIDSYMERLGKSGNGSFVGAIVKLVISLGLIIAACVLSFTVSPFILAGIALAAPIAIFSVRDFSKAKAARRFIEEARAFLEASTDSKIYGDNLLPHLIALRSSAEIAEAESARRESDTANARQLREEVDAFLARYTEQRGESALLFIQRNARELEYLISDTDKMKQELLAYKSANNIENAAAAASSPHSAELESDISECERHIALLKKQYDYDCALLETEDENRALLRELEDTRGAYMENLDTIQKTAKYLEKARDSLNSKYLGGTQASFEKYVEMIADETGDYSIDTTFRVSKSERGSAKKAEAYSRGTRDLYALAIRLSLIDALYENEAPFVMLDDPFASFDDEKTAAALALLERLSKDRQIIYMTCSKYRKP